MKRGRWAAWGIVAAVLMGAAILWHRSTPARPAKSAGGKRPSSSYGAAHRPSRSGATDQDEAPQRGDPDGASGVLRSPVPQPPMTREALRRAIREAARDALPWRYPGLCSDLSRSGPLSPRARYLATFIPTPVGLAVVYRDPEVDAFLPATFQKTLAEIQQRGTRSIHLKASFPAIYVYRSVEALREHSCASANAAAYYDGAIHIGPGVSFRDLQHEYTHHVLVTNGIERPLWLQEGLAMRAALEEEHERRDFWQKWKDHPLSMERMVNLFPTTADPEETATFYGQAYHMTHMLERLCLARSGCGPMELFDALRSGEATPETLFEWAVERRGSDLVAETHLPVWEDYLAHGSFGPENYRALLERANRVVRSRQTARRGSSAER
jgi:hypothetical protein